MPGSSVVLVSLVATEVDDVDGSKPGSRPIRHGSLVFSHSWTQTVLAFTNSKIPWRESSRP